MTGEAYDEVLSKAKTTKLRNVDSEVVMIDSFADELDLNAQVLLED